MVEVILEDVRSLASSFDFLLCGHVKRGGNTMAHLAARLGHVNGLELFIVSDFPQGIICLAEMDLE